MGDKSGIEWTEATWNPTTGCDRISSGCDRCYALTLAARLKAMGQPRYQRDGDPRTSGPGFGLTLHPDMLDKPLRWKRPRLIFVDSMSDLFHRDVPDEFIVRVFDTMARARQHTFQVLTKRSKRLARLTNERVATPDEVDAGCELGVVPGVWDIVNSGNPAPNVQLGVSIEDDPWCYRADHLRDADAAVRFISAEPLIGALPFLDLSGIDWLIVGGESGHGARSLDLAWVRDLRDRCAEAGTAFFVKQLGERWSIDNGHGRTHGGDWDVWPEDLRIREYPKAA